MGTIGACAGSGSDTAQSAAGQPARTASLPGGAIGLSLGGPTGSPPVAAGFVGVSLEYSTLEPYARPDTVSPAGGHCVVRIPGASALILTLPAH